MDTVIVFLDNYPSLCLYLKHNVSETEFCSVFRWNLLSWAQLIVEKNWWNEAWRENPKYSEKILPQRHFVHHKSHMTTARYELGPPPWEARD
jgi:hypothetical protein